MERERKLFDKAKSMLQSEASDIRLPDLRQVG